MVLDQLLILINKYGMVYSNTECTLFLKCILCNSAFLIGADVHLLHIQI